MQPITVAAISTRNYLNEPDRALRDVKSWARKAVDAGAQLAVFPEMNLTGYVHSTAVWDYAQPIPGPATEALVDIARELDVVLCCGIAERDADVVYNTQLFAGPEGLIGKQRKVHMPGIEYMYWRGGYDVDTFDIRGVRTGVTICYDSLFPELTRTLFFKGAELIVMPFAYTTALPRAKLCEQDIGIMTYRAACFGNGCFGVICNNGGTRKPSDVEPKGFRFPGWAGIFGPNGEVFDFTRASGNSPAMVISELDPKWLRHRRSSSYFCPRALRPEMYQQIGQPPQG